MAHTKQAKKRIRTDAERALRNRMRRSAMRTHIKRVLKAVADGDKAAAEKELALAHKKIDKAARTRVIHPNNAARRKSQLTLKVVGMA